MVQWVGLYSSRTEPSLKLSDSVGIVKLKDQPRLEPSFKIMFEFNLWKA